MDGRAGITGRVDRIGFHRPVGRPRDAPPETGAQAGAREA